MLHAVAKPNPQADFERAKQRLLEIIKRKSLMTEGGPFKLASGALSDWYLDLKPTTFDPEGSALIAEIIVQMLAGEPDIDAIGGLELGAVPIIAAVGVQSCHQGRPINGFVVRKEKKGHGTDRKIDGNFRDGMRVILIEDVTTKGGSVMQAVRAVRDRGAVVDKIVTVVDRLEGATQNLKNEGITLMPIFTKTELLAP
jgi:orotate phosphoribosyltransferase